MAPKRRKRRAPRARKVSRAQVRGELETLWVRSGLPGSFMLTWPRHMDERHRKSRRSYAQVQPDLPPHFELAGAVCELSPQHRLALLAHEIGHVLHPGSEDDADQAAERALGVRIGYDKRWPGKGLQVAMNPPREPDPDDAEGLVSWLEAEAKRKAREAGVAVPKTLTSFAPRPVQIEPGVIYFASGSNHAGEIAGFADLGLGLGVAAPECMRLDGTVSPCEQALIDLAGTGVPVFVDSGAFSEVEFGPTGPAWPVPITHEQWLVILAFYQRLARALGPQLYVVAPDRVADQRVTLERMTRYAPLVLAIKATGAKVIAPIQKGELSMADFYHEVTRILGPDVIAGVPLKKDATTFVQLEGFLQQVGHLLYGIHLLGLGPYGKVNRGDGSKKKVVAVDVVRLVRQLAPQAHLSQDSVLIRSAVGWGELDVQPRLVTQASWLAQELVAPAAWGSAPSGEEVKYWSDEDGGWRKIPDRDDALMDPASYLEPTKLRSLGKGWGLDKAQLKEWISAPDEFLQSESPHGISWWEHPEVTHDLENAWAKWLDDRMTATRKRLGVTYAFRGTAPSRLPEYRPPAVGPGEQGKFWTNPLPPELRPMRDARHQAKHERRMARKAAAQLGRSVSSAEDAVRQAESEQLAVKLLAERFRDHEEETGEPAVACPHCGEPEFLELLEYYPTLRQFEIGTCCLWSYEERLAAMREWTPDQWQEFFHEQAGVPIRSVSGDPRQRQAAEGKYLEAKAALGHAAVGEEARAATERLAQAESAWARIDVAPHQEWIVDEGVTLVRNTTWEKRVSGEAPAGALTIDEIREYILQHHKHAAEAPPGALWGYAVYNGMPTHPVYDGPPRLSPRKDVRPGQVRDSGGGAVEVLSALPGKLWEVRNVETGEISQLKAAKLKKRLSGEAQEGQLPLNMARFPSNLIGVVLVGRPASRYTQVAGEAVARVAAGEAIDDVAKDPRIKVKSSVIKGWIASGEVRPGETVAEVSRVAMDHSHPSFLTYKAASMIYTTAADDARAAGFTKIQTFTLESESGMSLRFARWKPVAEGVGGGQFTRKGGGRARAIREGELAKAKTRWDKKLT